MTEPILVREAKKVDLPALARLGADLARMHHRLDARRFFVVPGAELVGGRGMEPVGRRGRACDWTLTDIDPLVGLG